MDYLTLAGVIITLGSFLYAIYTNWQMTKLKEYQVGNLRNVLKNCIVVMSHSFKLTNNSEKYGITEKEAIARISAIHIMSTTLIRSLFHELSKIDTPFDEEKLNEYITCELITSKWVWKQAVTFKSTKSKIEPPDSLPNDTKDYLYEEPKNQ